MPIDFQDERNRAAYASRTADATWIGKIKELVHVPGQNVVDVGCGGGIYSKAFVELGARQVVGVDFSDHILTSARENCREVANVSFVHGTAYETSLPGGQYGIVMQRALIHHLDNLPLCFQEAYRLLGQGGAVIVQDRTPEDCLLPGSSAHIRGYFFPMYPELARTETERRHSSPKVKAALEEAGFSGIEEHSLWETRKVYPGIEMLAEDLLNRTGRSILHDLNDAQLERLVTHIKEQLGSAVSGEPIIEKDRWTIWKAVK